MSDKYKHENLYLCLLCNGFFSRGHNCFNPISLTEQIKMLDGATIANVNEPSAGDLERVLKANAELLAKYKKSESDLKLAVEMLEKFITKSNGLSFYVRNSHLKDNLNKSGEFEDLINRLESLYEFQCDTEKNLAKIRGGT